MALFGTRDEGIGIDPQFADRIFVIFPATPYQGGIPRNRHRSGHLQKIVERHGGRMWVESETGKGGDLLVPAFPTLRSNPPSLAQKALQQALHMIRPQSKGAITMVVPELVKPIEILRKTIPEMFVLTIEALKEAKVINHRRSSGTGWKPRPFCGGRVSTTAAPRPHLIVLDLNLPRKGRPRGARRYQADDSLKRIPVVVSLPLKTNRMYSRL